MTTTNASALSDGADKLGEAIMELYIETGKPATVSDLAKRLGVAQSTVHRWLNTVYGCPDGCDEVTVASPVRERNYNTIQYHRTVIAFVPARARLRTMVCELRKQF